MSNSLNMMMGGTGAVAAPITSPSKPVQSQVNSFNPPGYSLPGPVTDSASKSWMESLAKAWGTALDAQAGEITSLSDSLTNHGSDQPSTLTQLTAASLKMQFLSTSSSTSNNAVGQALDTLGRKQ